MCSQENLIKDLGLHSRNWSMYKISMTISEAHVPHEAIKNPIKELEI